MESNRSKDRDSKVIVRDAGLKTADEWGATPGRTKVNDNQWHHAVGVYDDTRIALYIDGKLDASAPASSSILTNDKPVLIGENSEKSGRFWHGLLDEIHVYSYALSEDEIAALYKEATVDAGTSPPLMGGITPDSGCRG